ncbi:MAG: glycosyltransferase [Acidimicrobiales bacterium]|nr:glycosyltransferase [Acidimicrobiales bacterium]MCB9393693.1 glycosyltransferase [Acidimicrobiaceae bacterium]
MSAPAVPPISVAMSTHNRVDSLRRVLPPLLDDPGTLEVVVVSNGSTDGTAELLLDMARREPRLRPIVLERDLGRIGGRRTAVEACRSDVVLIVDDDVLAGAGMVSGHARHHAAHDGPLVVVGYMPTPFPVGRRAGSFSTLLYARGYERHAAMWERDPDRILVNIWAGNVSYPRATFLDIDAGRFWPENSYHDDKFYGIELYRRGVPATFDRSLAAVHLHRRSLEASLADWRLQGRDWIVLHRSASDILGQADLGQFTESLPGPLAALVRASDDPDAYRRIRAGLVALVRTGTRTRCFPLEMRAGQMLRRVEIRHAARAELHRHSNDIEGPIVSVA